MHFVPFYLSILCVDKLFSFLDLTSLLPLFWPLSLPFDLCPDSTPITATKTHSTNFTSPTHDPATMTRIELFNAFYLSFVTVKTLDKKHGIRMGTKVVIDLNVKCDKYLLCSIDAEKKSFSSVCMFTDISF